MFIYWINEFVFKVVSLRNYVGRLKFPYCVNTFPDQII